MPGKKFFLLVNLISFLILGGSGLVMFFAFRDLVFHKTLGMNQQEWLSIHTMFASVTVVSVFYHVAERWHWVEQVILRKSKAKFSTEIVGRRRNNTWLIIIFTFTASTGFINWILDGDCAACVYIHNKLGIALWLVILMHLYKHRNILRSR
jgi:cytochrome b561